MMMMMPSMKMPTTMTRRSIVMLIVMMTMQIRMM